MDSFNFHCSFCAAFCRALAVASYLLFLFKALLLSQVSILATFYFIPMCSRPPSEPDSASPSVLAFSRSFIELFDLDSFPFGRFLGLETLLAARPSFGVFSASVRFRWLIDRNWLPAPPRPSRDPLRLLLRITTVKKIDCCICIDARLVSPSPCC